MIFKRVLICCTLLLTIGQLKAQDTLAKYILTPAEKPTPQINGPKVFGVRPGHPLLFTVSATGTRPLSISIKNLPAGLKFDKQTDQLSGIIKIPGTYPISITVKNSAGQTTRELKIVVGETIALTPPMGWNSWNIYAGKISQALVLANAKAMVSSGLINHGWTYMNMDDVWQGKRGGEFNAIMPDSTTFPDMTRLTDAIHKMGLKVGIYSTPWMESYGGRIGGTADNVQGILIKSKEKIPYNKKMPPFAIGQYNFVDDDVKQFVKWGVDYLKYDWYPIELPETKQMFDALRASGRDMVFSLSNSTPFGSMADLSKISNSWRTGGDINDSWKSLKPRLLSQDKWAKFASPGHWNDPDMLIVGYVGWGRDIHLTKLTANEQYTHISAWCLMSVPLLLGCDLTKIDPFTYNLLSNDEVIAVDQDPLGKQATLVFHEGDLGILAKDMADGGKAVGLFNTADGGTKNMALKWADLGISGKYIIRDLWRQKDIGVFEGEFKTDVPQHGVVMVSLRATKN